MSWVLLGTFVLLGALGMPLAVSLGLAVVVTVLLYDLQLSVVAQQMLSSMNSFILTAVPMFVLAGTLMDRSGSASMMFTAAQRVMGHWRGGLGHVNVVVSVLFGGKSGSSVADVASLGPLQVKAMEENGYPREYAAALSLVTATLASVVPPSILMIVAAATAGESVGAALIGGAGPAALFAVLFFVVNYGLVVRFDYGRIEQGGVRAAAVAVFRALPALGAPVIIIGGIFSGIVTPTEAAALAVLYTLVIATLFYRRLRLADIPRALVSTGVTSGTVLLIAMTASVATYIFAIDGLPSQLSSLLLDVTDDPLLVLLLLGALFVIVGMFMDIIAAIVLLVPVTMPTAIAAGVDPIHFIVFMVAALAAGLTTPPVGVCLFAMSYVSELSIERIVRSATPFYVALLLALILIAAVPGIVLVPVGWMG